MAAFVNPAAQELYDILKEARTIAVVGASSNPARPSHGIMRLLQASGYRVIPVNPHEETILGEKAYGSLRDIPETIDIVNVFRQADATPPIASEAVEIRAKALWLQLGIASEEAAAIAKAGGLTVIMDKCIAVVLGQLNVPRPGKPDPL